MLVLIFLNGLPPEILHRIVQYLDEAYPPSIQAFASVNTMLYSAAMPVLFHTIRISVSCRDDLPQDILKCVQKYTQQLQHTASFQRVRCLVIDNDYMRFPSQLQSEAVAVLSMDTWTSWDALS